MMPRWKKVSGGWLAEGTAASLLLLMFVGCNSNGSEKEAGVPDGLMSWDTRFPGDTPPNVRDVFVPTPSDGPSDRILSASAPEAGSRDSTLEGTLNDVLSEDTAPDPCRPACLYRLLGGCLPGGGCTYNALGQYCYGNGVKEIPLPPGGVDQQQILKDDVLCAVQQVGGTYVDPNKSVLGRLKVNADKSTTVTCTGEEAVIIPATCVSPAAGCVRGACNGS